jgi:hypothetical protein
VFVDEEAANSWDEMNRREVWDRRFEEKKRKTLQNSYLPNYTELEAALQRELVEEDRRREEWDSKYHQQSDPAAIQAGATVPESNGNANLFPSGSNYQQSQISGENPINNNNAGQTNVKGKSKKSTLLSFQGLGHKLSKFRFPRRQSGLVTDQH